MPKEKPKFRKIDLNKTCRICLTERGKFREIFPTKIPKLLENCANIKVKKGDKLPSNICQTCFHLTVKFSAFKRKIERSDRILRNFIRQNQFKQENILHIAITEAQIDKLINSSDDDDISLSQRLKKYNERRPEIIKIENEDIDQTIEIHTNFDEKLIIQNIIADNSPIPIVTSVDPPPLIPLKPAFKAESHAHSAEIGKCDEDDQPPPLVPLKEPKSDEAEADAADFKCTICCKEFKERKRLIGHLKGHMVAKDLICKICGKRYATPSTFRVHMRTHTGERPFKCQVCGKGFVRWAGVVGHMKTHQSVKPFACEACGKCFKIASNLARHKITHMEAMPFGCTFCGKTFGQADNRNLHILTYHTNERPYLCNECGKGFVSSTRLTRHMWVHSGYKPYTCKCCPKAYSNSNDLRNHEKVHLDDKDDDDADEGKRFICNVCGLRFYQACRLNRHMKIHERAFLCRFCGKTFSSNTILRKHLLSKKHSQQFGEMKNEAEIST